MGRYNVFKSEKFLNQWEANSEIPWIKRQVEGHLLFGSRRNQLIFAFLGTAFILLVGGWYVYTSQNPGARFLWLLDGPMVILAGPLFFFRSQTKGEAAFYWVMTKCILVFVCFAVLIGGGLVGYFRGLGDAPYLTALALIWFPGPEFIKPLIPYQKYMTLFRILSTPVLLYFGSLVGDWVW